MPSAEPADPDRAMRGQATCDGKCSSGGYSAGKSSQRPAVRGAVPMSPFLDTTCSSTAIRGVELRVLLITARNDFGMGNWAEWPCRRELQRRRIIDCASPTRTAQGRANHP